MRTWPGTFADWADGNPLRIAKLKFYHILHSDGVGDLVDSEKEVKDCLQNNWPEDFQSPIRSLLEVTFTAFRDSTDKTPGRRTEVSHAQFVKILDEWLIDQSGLEDEHSNCPNFKDSG